MQKMMQGELEGSFNAAMRNAPSGMDAGADAALSELGQAQANRLGEVWAPLLLEKARSGKLMTFVSPFLRTLATADPLLSKIQSHVPTYTATLLPAIMEVNGLTHADDFRIFDRIEKLRSQRKVKEVRDALKSIQWKPMGMSGAQIAAKFPWARVADAASLRVLDSDNLNVNVPMNSPWWTKGFESRKDAAKRIREVAEWLLGSVVANRSGLTGDDTVVLLIAHGDVIARITNFLLHASYTNLAQENPLVSVEGMRNTSVTSLLLPSAEYAYAGERPNSTGEVVR